MGHMLNNTIQDILVRRLVCWAKCMLGMVPTMPQLLPKLKLFPNLRQKVLRGNLSREEFLNHAGIGRINMVAAILEQLKTWCFVRLGSYSLTMDDERSYSVLKFCRSLMGYIYRDTNGKLGSASKNTFPMKK